MRMQTMAGLMDKENKRLAWLLQACGERIAHITTGIATAKRYHPKKT